MMEKIFIFWGSNRDFEELLYNEIPQDEIQTYFMEIIQNYNSKLRNTSKQTEEERIYKYNIENLVVRASDYASVLEHAVHNFINIITINHNVGRMFLHNPPDSIVRSIKTIMDDDTIEESYSDYVDVDRSNLQDVYLSLESKIIGHTKAKRSILTSMYKSINKKENKPITLLLYGPSGIGKTETAKDISSTLGGNLLRIQFSMMQASEAYNYVFGSDHSKICLARDLLERETNIVLIDEFDKVHPQFYNAFYQLFDEGLYTDIHYKVDARKCIFICTTNFKSEKEAEEYMGSPMYSRFTDLIQYYMLSDSEKIEIATNLYKNCISNLTEDELLLLKDNEILKFYINKISSFNNVRILKRRIEEAIYRTMANHFIFNSITDR